MKTFVVTGISGSGRVEFLNELKNELENRGKKIAVFNVGQLIIDTAIDLQIPIPDEKILDIDRTSLRLLRELALLNTRIEVQEMEYDYCFIGIHATFPWRGQLIDGINFHTLKKLKIDGFINVIDTIQDIQEKNNKNPKWQGVNKIDLESTNNWLIEEDFVTHLLASFLQTSVITIGRKHSIKNIADLFVEDKKSIYLSYPISHISQEYLNKIDNEIRPTLEEHFVVFNPLVIKDLEKAKSETVDINKLSQNLMEDLGQRTVSRDYRFIDQCDFVIAIYQTDKLSPGVLSELFYANSHGKNTYVIFPTPASPFLEAISTIIFKDFESLLKFLQENNFFRNKDKK